MTEHILPDDIVYEFFQLAKEFVRIKGLIKDTRKKGNEKEDTHHGK